MLRLHRCHLFFVLVLLSGFVSFTPLIFAAGASIPIEGKGSVAGNAGAFTYSVPIDVPPGRQGLTPELALTYNSSGENGFLGVGWDLPIGYVMRSTKSGVAYNCVSSAANPCFVFMLGDASSELIPRTDWCSDCFGAKIESGFVKFRFISNTYWQAIDRNGTKYFFGQTPASRQDNPADTTQVFKWELDTVTDTHNNTLTYAYFKDQGETYIDKIDYQANHIVFNRDNTRTDKPTLYGPNFAVTTAYRLSGIDIYSNWNGSTGGLNRKYAFGYCGTTGVSCAVSATGRSVLGKVTQYGSDGVTTLSEMTFTPQNVEVNWTTPTWSGYSLSDAPIGDQCLSGDLDGNGKSDIWCQTASGSGVWDVRLSTGAGWTSQSWSGPSPSFPISNQCFTGDLDGNGKIDFWCESGSGNGSWDVRLSTGTGWTPATWTGSVSNFPITGRCFTGDLQGGWKDRFMVPDRKRFRELVCVALHRKRLVCACCLVRPRPESSCRPSMSDGGSQWGWKDRFLVSERRLKWELESGDFAGDELVDLLIVVCDGKPRSSRRKSVPHRRSEWRWENRFLVPDGE